MKEFLHLVPTVIFEYENEFGERIYQTEDGQHLNADEFDEQFLPKTKRKARFDHNADLIKKQP